MSVLFGLYQPEKGEIRKDGEDVGTRISTMRWLRITVGMKQRTEILKILYRDNEVIMLDEPTAVFTLQEIDELMKSMKGLAAEGIPYDKGSR